MEGTKFELDRASLTKHAIILGATGSGKSSTFNALSGLDLAAVGVKRPTTSWTMSCTWGAEGAEELLRNAAEHAKEHGIVEVTPELIERAEKRADDAPAAVHVQIVDVAAAGLGLRVVLDGDRSGAARGAVAPPQLRAMATVVRAEHKRVPDHGQLDGKDAPVLGDAFERQDVLNVVALCCASGAGRWSRACWC